MISAILLLSSAAITVVPLTDGRFEVSVNILGSSPQHHEDSQRALMRAAAKQCKGRGRAVSTHQLTLSVSEPDKHGNQWPRLSETFSCETAPT